MRLHFYKMQGIGNDYIYIDGFAQKGFDPPTLAVKVSDRHFGIGSDGIILLLPSTVADLRMSMFNADGSEGKMCGNGIRCLGKLAYDTGICKKTKMSVETRAGIKTLELMIENGSVTGAAVDMGSPQLDAALVPVVTDKQQMINEPFSVCGETYCVTCVSMGNPHAVIFRNGIDALALDKIGPLFEKNKMFPQSVNTEFVEVIDSHTLRMRVWERGSGETLACGTGACASVVAACLNGYCKRGDEVTVRLRGGELAIRWENDSVMMRGPAELVFTGDIEI